MLRKIEKNAKSKEEALELAAQEFGVPVSELSYKVEREVGKGLMGLLLGKEVIISAWITKEAEEEEEKLRKIAQKRAESEKLEAKVADIRIINRAKLLLVQHLQMTETEAHKYIEKQAMNTSKPRRTIAENIIRTYED